MALDYLGITDDSSGRGTKVNAVVLRILHVFAFRDGLLSREQVWVDSGAIVAQLTAT